jgi:hypothetical protein
VETSSHAYNFYYHMYNVNLIDLVYVQKYTFTCLVKSIRFELFYIVLMRFELNLNRVGFMSNRVGHSCRIE